MKNLLRRMSDAHEIFLAALLKGRRAKGSGNQWHDPIDGRQNHRLEEWAFAWDGKSTLGKSVSVTREMWEKAREQAGAERPMLALRFYNNERLDVDHDLVVVDAYDFAEMQEKIRDYRLLTSQ
jgi:hypothetical protein